MSATGGIDPTKYSWVDYASKQGYATLSYDRICNGKSTHLEGLIECQTPLNAEVLKQLILQAKAGVLGGRKFTTVIPVGHSEGSIIQQSMVQASPNVVDIIIQTGFSNKVINFVPGAVAIDAFTPAILVKPSLGIIDPAYLMINSASGFQTSFYYGQFLTAVSGFDYAGRGTFTVGELATGLLTEAPAQDYAGAVYVLNGAEDAVFCTQDPLGPLSGPSGHCDLASDPYTAGTVAYYPNAKSFDYYNVAETGHCINTHENAQDAYAAVHSYLSSLGY